MLISDWSSDVCSSDLCSRPPLFCRLSAGPARLWPSTPCGVRPRVPLGDGSSRSLLLAPSGMSPEQPKEKVHAHHRQPQRQGRRSEEHTSELQSLMRISYAVFCLKKKRQKTIVYKVPTT